MTDGSDTLGPTCLGDYPTGKDSTENLRDRSLQFGHIGWSRDLPTCSGCVRDPLRTLETVDRPQGLVSPDSPWVPHPPFGDSVWVPVRDHTFVDVEVDPVP